MGWQQQAAGLRAGGNVNLITIFSGASCRCWRYRDGEMVSMTELLLVSLLISWHDSSSLAPDPEH